MDNTIKRRKFIKKAATIGTGFFFGGAFIPGKVKANFFTTNKKPDIGVINGENYFNNTISAINILGGMKKFVSRGDVVVVKHHEDWGTADDRICVVRVNGEVTLKKVTVFSEGEEVLLSPFNKEYSPLLINEDNYGEAYLVGIAIMAIKNL